MIKLTDILKEILKGTNQAPYGIMFFGKDKVLVGDDHKNPIKLSKDLFDKVIEIGKKHGYYGEGTGISANRAVKNSEVYKTLVTNKAQDKGSWDDKIKPSNLSDFLYALFSNVKENHRFKKLKAARKEGETIYSLLQRTKDTWAAKKGASNSDLDKFLKAISGNYDFVKMAQEKATDENLQKFLEVGENDMWPSSNWKEYPNPSGKVARKATMVRDEWIIKAGPGVYFIGNGHLKDIQDMEGGKIIGGEKIGSGSSIDKK